MKKLYTAVGRMQFKGRNRDMRCPMVLLNNKEYILDIQEMMIWSILNWRILSDDEIKTLYENKAQETGYMTHRSAAECIRESETGFVPDFSKKFRRRRNNLCALLQIALSTFQRTK